jgi:hypothetical protein
MHGNGTKMDEKIYIDFVGGAHGNFLEFVCNVFVANIKVASMSPFNGAGAAHRKQYLENPKFISNHYTTYNQSLHNKKVIQIQVDIDDLLPLQCISLLRAGNYNIKPEDLEINTYHKLNNKDYRWVLNNLIAVFFNVDHLIQGYRDIADPGWPDIHSVDDYLNLPLEIQQECTTVHGFKVNVLDANNPHCPRAMLKEFFKIGFLDPKNHGLMLLQQKNIHVDCDVYEIPFSSFYSQTEFIDQILKISKFTTGTIAKFDQQYFTELHNEFLSKQPYKNIKTECDLIVNMLIQKSITIVPEKDVIQEAYIAAKLEQFQP